MVRGSEPQVGLSAVSTELGACFRSSVPLSLCPSPALTLFVSLSNINPHQKKKGTEAPGPWSALLTAAPQHLITIPGGQMYLEI